MLRAALLVVAMLGTAHADVEVDLQKMADAGLCSTEPLVDVVKRVSKRTHANFVIREGMKQKRIVVACGERTTFEGSLDEFLDVLEVNGLAIAKAGKFFKILPLGLVVHRTVPIPRATPPPPGPHEI